MPLDLNSYQATAKDIWQGRHDTAEIERYFQIIDVVNVQIDPLLNHDIALIGFCSDEGVRRNMGRVGAKDGPNSLRKHLANLTLFENTYRIADVGNIICQKRDLTTTQKDFSHIISWIMAQSALPVGLGGGHEIAWAHYCGLKDKFADDLAIVNFDAHLDIRPKINNQNHSGSSFRQIAESCKEHDVNFNYYCYGLQHTANTKSLIESAQSLQTKMRFVDEIPLQSWDRGFFNTIIKNHKNIYVTFCLDVLNIAHAPGVSAPQALGLYPEQVLPALQYLAQSGKVIAFDIAELAPNLDENEKTAKLAAHLVSEFIHSYKASK